VVKISYFEFCKINKPTTKYEALSLAEEKNLMRK
jgi:hypothetical protein